MYSGFCEKKYHPKTTIGPTPTPAPPTSMLSTTFRLPVLLRGWYFFMQLGGPPELSQTNIEVGVARGTAPNTRMMRWYFISQKPDLEFTPLGTCQRRSRLPQWGHHAAFKCGGDQTLFIESTKTAARAQASMQVSSKRLRNRRA